MGVSICQLSEDMQMNDHRPGSFQSKLGHLGNPLDIRIGQATFSLNLTGAVQSVSRVIFLF